MRNLIIGSFALVACIILGSSVGCDVGPKEGDSCNGLIVENECIEGNTCQTIGSCSQTYCCPADPATSFDPHCNGALCPPIEVDAGDDDAAPDGG